MGGREAEPPWERQRELSRVQEAGRILDPWSEPKGRGERCVRCPFAVAVPEAHGVPDSLKGGEGDRGARRARAGALWGDTVRSRSSRGSGPLPGSATSPEIEFISLLPGFSLFSFFLFLSFVRSFFFEN